MRPQGNRRSRRNGGGHPHSHGGHGGHGGHSGHSSHHSHGQQNRPRSAMSLRNQIFDSNGPDIRVRGNAFQVHEKYQALAKDALSSGDRVLAENYLQHAEHYFRIIEAINEATALEQRQRQVAYGDPQQQPNVPPGANGYYTSVGDMNQQPPQQQTQGAQTSVPGAAMRGPVTVESGAEPAPGNYAEGEEEPGLDGPQTAAAGRR